ncbi:MAG TPA: radical SAM protein [Fibrobacteraceae bacterium]|nr:radical SAM protein [Fibrobacteraceae bacterium]
MISISRLFLGHHFETDQFRYGRDPKLSSSTSSNPAEPSQAIRSGRRKVHERPVVVWNSTNRCNLKCVHCYAKANQDPHPDELSTVEAKTFIDDLAQYGAPVLLLSGGEPLARKDAVELIGHARDRGMRPVLSTNGTMINLTLAQELKDAGATYAGISLDGMENVNDEFRGVPGAFKKALEGIHACLSTGLKVGLRFTINRRNQREIPAIIQLLAEEGIPRACFYHLVYAGRGAGIAQDDLNATEARAAMDTLLEGAKELQRKGKSIELLTVANHCDGPYIYLRLLREGLTEEA